MSTLPRTADEAEKQSPTSSGNSTSIQRHLSDVGSALARHESVDAESLASIDRPPSESKLPAAKIYHPFSLPVLALLMPASVFGVLARLGLQALVTYDGQSIFPLAYVQATGCFIMGIGLGIKEPFGRYYGPLYTAMTTGFCGSLTTFSGWQYDIFESWINEGRYDRAGLRDVVDGITKTIFTLIVSIASVQFGVYISTNLSPRLPALSPPGPIARYTVTAISVLIYAATFPAYFRLPAEYRHQATAALLFSFPGTLTRYILSIKVNPLIKAMPLGTFTANALGTALLGTFHVLQNTAAPKSANACALLQGLLDGYCGCLTTVSTFAAEVGALKKQKAWFYAALSWITGQLLLLVILGPSIWVGNVREQPTCRFA
ncbi:hypothetical protein HWV62_3584 [Athelia sp. TMB]|nr:hypothetical protein HWV62_3584 [Athelia sp. TMB]